jgi:hypothetical protein
VPKIQPKSNSSEIALASVSNVLRINNLNITEVYPPVNTMLPAVEFWSTELLH